VNNQIESLKMEINQQTIQAVVTYLQQTMSSDANVRRPAEKYLESVEVNQNYPIVLLSLIDDSSIELITRISGAITFKNYVKRNWVEDDGKRISESDRLAIKQTIISVMLNREDQIQRQLSDAVAIIGKEDFPEKWNHLLDELVDRIRTSGSNFQIINGILQTCHSLFKRFRHEFRSDELFSIIKFVLDKFARPFTDLFVALINLTQTTQTPESLKVIYSSIVISCKIYYSLNAQDLPEFFEDNLAIWMPNFLQLLGVENKALETDSDDEVGLLQQVKSEICDIISMYAQKYHEEFECYLQKFVEAVWKLLTTSGQEPKFDILISNAIKFLSTVANRPQFKQLFESPGVLSSLCTNVIIPNIEFRQCDIELFEDNPEDFIRADIEGSDVDTRRKSACDLVRALSKHFEADVVKLFSDYIKVMLDSFAANPNEFWKNKDAAIYLVTAICVKGSTARYGTTQTTKLVDVVEFYNKFVRTDIDNNDDINSLPVLRADGLKYIMTFRNQLPFNEVLIPSLPVIIKHLACRNQVIHTYAANTLEKIFAMKGENKETLIKPEHLAPILEPLITSLFGVLTFEGSAENEYIMKAIMRTIAVSGNSIQPYLSAILTHLNSKLAEVCKNPSKPYFNHYLFESIAVSLRVALSLDPSSTTVIENSIFKMFEDIVQQDVQEFLPYCIQLLSLLLECNPAPQIPDNYLSLLTYLVQPQFWEKSGNILPMIRFLKSFIRKSPQQICSSGKLEAILGIFQKLVASRVNDHEGIDLLQCLFTQLPAEALQNYVKQIFMLLFTRLSDPKSKTSKYVRLLIIFFSFFAFKFGPQPLEDIIEGIQSKMFGMVLEKLFIAECRKVDGREERKILCVGATRILTESTSLIDGHFSQLWPKLLESLIAVFELPVEDEVIKEELNLELEENLGYQATYCKLQFAPSPQYDLFEGKIPDARLFLAQALHKLSQGRPGVLENVINQNLDQRAVEHLRFYFQNANLTLN